MSGAKAHAPATSPGVVRSSISPLLWAGVAAWVAAVGGTEAALVSWKAASPAPVVAAALAVGRCGLLVARKARSGAVRLILGIAVLAAACAVARGVVFELGSERLGALPPGEFAVTVVGDAEAGPYGVSAPVRLDVAPYLTAYLSVPSGVAAPLYGQRLLISSRVRVAQRGDAAGDRAFRSGAMLRLRPWRMSVAGWGGWPLGAVGRWRDRTVARLRALGDAGGESLASMLFAADPAGPGLQAMQDARTSGVAWAISASGLHLAAIVLLMDRLAALTGLGRRGRAAAAVVAVVVMALACGLKLSLIRAGFAAAGVVASRALGRRRDATAWLGGALVIVLVVDPGAAYDTGLLLGAVAVGGIAVFGGMTREWLRCVAGRRAAQALGATLAAQFAVAPLVAAMFGGVSLLGPLALLASAPLVSMGTTLGFAASLLAGPLPVIGDALLRVSAVIAGAAARVWALVASIPGAFVAIADVPPWVMIAWAAAAGALWLRWPSPRRSARVRAGATVAVAGAVLLVLVRGAGLTGIVALDVGQGDAILIRDGGHAVLVDTGPDPLVLRRGRAGGGVPSRAGGGLWHAHADHTGGLDGLAGIARPGWIGVPDVEDADVEKLAKDCASRSVCVERLRAGMRFAVGGAQVEVLWPKGGERNLSANNTSVILLVRNAACTALLLGDAETDAQEGALPAWHVRVDCLKVAHHGSPNGNVPDALAVWRPSVALISVGVGNKFGHPSRAALDSLTAVGATIERTDLSGDLCWRFEGPAQSAASVVAPASGRALCDNRGAVATVVRDDHGHGTWLPRTYPISSRSISSTVPRNCCCSAPRSGCATAWPPWRTSTSTWTPSTARPPPRTPC